MKRLDFKKNWDLIILLIVVILAIFIRSFHFSDWLFFAMDQGRDAKLIREAVENGAAELPLLGPRAAGTFLRLGPVFYYFEYISAKIFGSTGPAVMAYPDFLFSILGISLFYYFLRLYFRKPASLIGAAMYAASFIAIQYSRFAWNPNSIPFWTLLTFFALLKFFRSVDTRWKYAWLGLAALGWGIASQLHFLVFVTLPIAIAFFFVWNGGIKKMNWKAAGLVFLILLILYSPMILSDLQTGGDNIEQFIFALKNKPQEEYSWSQKFFQNFVNHGNYYTLYSTSYASRTGKASMVAGLLLIFATLLKVFWKYKEEKNGNKKAFLRIILVWFFGFFVLLIPFAFQIRTRFFFPVFFLPFVFFAFWFEWLFEWKKWRAVGYLLAGAVFISTMALNGEATCAWYQGLAKEKDPKSFTGRVLVIKQIRNVTASQLKNLADYLRKRSDEEGKSFELYGSMTYRVPVQYYLEAEPVVDYGLITRSDNDRSKLYFAMTSDIDGYEDIPFDIRSKFNLVSVHSFSYRLKLFELELKEIQPDFEKEKKAEKKDEEKKDENEEPRPRRTERVLWGEIF